MCFIFDYEWNINDFLTIRCKKKSKDENFSEDLT